MKLEDLASKPAEVVNGSTGEEEKRKRVNPERFDPGTWDVKRPRLTIEPVKGKIEALKNC